MINPLKKTFDVNEFFPPKVATPVLVSLRSPFPVLIVVHKKQFKRISAKSTLGPKAIQLTDKIVRDVSPITVSVSIIESTAKLVIVTLIEKLVEIPELNPSTPTPALFAPEITVE